MDFYKKLGGMFIPDWSEVYAYDIYGPRNEL